MYMYLYPLIVNIKLHLLNKNVKKKYWVEHRNTNLSMFYINPAFDLQPYLFLPEMKLMCENSKYLLTLSLIQQFCSRRLWTYFVKKWKISIIEWITYDWKCKTLWQKEKLHVLCNFFFCHYVFKKPSAAEASESVYMRERVKWKTGEKLNQ